MRVVGQGGADAGEHGAAFGALDLHVVPRRFAGNPLALAVGQRGFAVEAGGGFQLHKRAAAFDAGEEAAVELPRFAFHQAAGYLNAGGFKHGQPLARHQGVGVLHGGHHAAHAGADQGFGAGRSTAVVGAGLEGNVSGGALRGVAGLAQGVHFGMRLAGLEVETLADNLPALLNHAADARIGRSGKTALPAKGNGLLHQGVVGMGESGHVE